MDAAEDDPADPPITDWESLKPARVACGLGVGECKMCFSWQSSKGQTPA